VETELAGQRRTQLAGEANPDLQDRAFVDSSARKHELDPALRNRLKPQWRVMCDRAAIARPPTDEALAGRARQAIGSVEEAVALVTTLGESPFQGRLLEIGCYDGAIAFQLASRPNTSVVASDLARYYLVQEPGSTGDQDIARKVAELTTLRSRARTAGAQAGAEVEFVEDDITASHLEPGSFDGIVSFEVLEHVADPIGAFRSIARLLRPGAITYHVYNPFFSVNGGHSLCTLDFAWGHARLDPGDFERYVREIRPAEADQALRFYRESLNRMTLAGLRSSVEEAGLELLAVLPWIDRSLARQLTAEAMSEVQTVYPSAVEVDLLATFVTLVARRPGP
jgi:SAM-dependent methyltransferase